MLTPRLDACSKGLTAKADSTLLMERLEYLAGLRVLPVGMFVKAHNLLVQSIIHSFAILAQITAEIISKNSSFPNVYHQREAQMTTLPFLGV